MDMLMRETSQAMRRLMRRPAFTVAALVTLALGIGATTAIFSVVETVLLRPLPYPEGDRLVAIGHESQSDVLGMPDGGFLHYRARSRAVESMALYIESSAPVFTLELAAAPNLMFWNGTTPVTAEA